MMLAATITHRLNLGDGSSSSITTIITSASATTTTTSSAVVPYSVLWKVMVIFMVLSIHLWQRDYRFSTMWTVRDGEPSRVPAQHLVWGDLILWDNQSYKAYDKDHLNTHKAFMQNFNWGFPDLRFHGDCKLVYCYYSYYYYYYYYTTTPSIQ